MGDQADPTTTEVPLDELRQIDQHCARFEQLWRRGEHPRIEDFLSTVASPQRRALFRELVVLEFEYRKGRGESPQPEDYAARFPEFSQLLAPLFQSVGMPDTRTRSYDPAQETQDLAPAVADTARASLVDVLPRRFGSYQLEREIARGGMGIVYQARRIGSERPLALKMVLSGAVATRAEVVRFRREAEAAAQLDHPHIVPIYEIGETEGHVYFTMALVQGESLSDRLKRGPMTPREAAYFVLQIAEAVEYAHRRGIVHRDLKPGNVLIDRGGNVLVTDFGLAKRLDDAGVLPAGGLEPAEAAEAGTPTDALRPADLTRTGTVLGTPAYMAPEQATSAKDAGPPADIYSLGVILYALLTGRPPFLAATLGELIQQLLQRPPVPPSEINRQVDRTLEAICLRCLEKEPSQRYATAGEMAEHLRNYVSGQPVKLPGSGRWDRCVRYLNENPALVPVTTGLLVRPWLGWSEALFLGTLLGGWTINRRLTWPRRPLAIGPVTLLGAALALLYCRWALGSGSEAALFGNTLLEPSFAVATLCGGLLAYVVLVGGATLTEYWQRPWRGTSLLCLAALLALPPFAAWRIWLAGPGYGGYWSQTLVDWTVISLQLLSANLLAILLGLSAGMLLNGLAHRTLLSNLGADKRPLILFQLAAAALALFLCWAIPAALAGAEIEEVRAPAIGPVLTLAAFLPTAMGIKTTWPDLLPIIAAVTMMILAAPLFLAGWLSVVVQRFFSRRGRA